MRVLVDIVSIRFEPVLTNEFLGVSFLIGLYAAFLLGRKEGSWVIYHRFSLPLPGLSEVSAVRANVLWGNPLRPRNAAYR